MPRQDNPYKELVEKHDKIFVQDNELFNKSGKWNKFFGNDNEIFLEIGTGMGNFFSKESADNLDKNLLEIYIG